MSLFASIIRIEQKTKIMSFFALGVIAGGSQ